MNATMNGTFVSPPPAAAPAPRPEFDPELVRARWSVMPARSRRAFVAAIGPRASVREFGLPALEVALAWAVGLPVEARLARVLAVSRD